MAGSGKRGSGDRVLESRHLVGLFLGVVLLCAVFFTLGYVMGKTQYDSAVHAASPKPGATAAPREAQAREPQASTAETSGAASGEWDFYTQKHQDRLEPAPKTSEPARTSSARPATEKKSPRPSRERAIREDEHRRTSTRARSGIVLQVAALTHRGDALTMADVLHRKGFPSFVTTPTTDRFYRVQVGPYRSEHAAESARRALESAGFKSIVKR